MERRNIRIGCDFVYVAQAATPTLFLVRPGDNPGVNISDERWSLNPEAEADSYSDLYGNNRLRMTIPGGRSIFHYEAIADVPDAAEDVDFDAPEIAPEKLPGDTLIYTLSSRYALSDVLARQAWSRFGNIPPGYGRVQAICDYVHNSLQFQYGTSNAQSTAVDIFVARRGVCRDFAHLAITFCRALNIPARYAFGYLPFVDLPSDGAPADFAAWIEVWLGDRWWTFDPRNNMVRKGRVVIGRGRDAADVAMSTTFGGPWLEQMVVYSDEISSAAPAFGQLGG